MTSASGITYLTGTECNEGDPTQTSKSCNTRRQWNLEGIDIQAASANWSHFAVRCADKCLSVQGCMVDSPVQRSTSILQGHIPVYRTVTRRRLMHDEPEARDRPFHWVETAQYHHAQYVKGDPDRPGAAGTQHGTTCQQAETICSVIVPSGTFVVFFFWGNVFPKLSI